MIKNLFSISYCANIIPHVVLSNVGSANFSNVYLCTQSDKLKPYKCIMFLSHLEADNYYKQKYSGKVIFSTIIPVCKFIPLYFHKNILKHKLSNLLINVEIEK
jgi:hypothetical protein